MERFEWVRRDQNLTYQQFADILGLSKSTIDNIIYKRVKKVKDLYIRLLCEKLNVNKDWIIKGKGVPYYKKTGEDLEFVKCLDKMAEHSDPTLRTLMTKINQLSDQDLTLTSCIVNRLLSEDH